MEDIIGGVRPYLEALYFISGIVLTVGIVFAWKQLLAFREDINTRNYRISKEKAVEACQLYLDEYVKLSNEEYIIRENCSHKAYSGDIGDFTRKSLSNDNIVSVIKYLKADQFPVLTLNKLEIIASMFISNVADERTGFRIIGRSFCSSVEYRYDIITFLRADEASQPYWYNIIELYHVWSKRIKQQELQSQMGAVQDALSSLGPERSMMPVGVKE